MKYKEKILDFLKSKKMLYIIIFMFFMLLCYMFPYSHDDWAWGTNIGIERLQSYFNNYNGRWFGNFTVLLLTRSNFLKTFIMTITLTLIIYLINKIIDSDEKTTILLNWVLILAMPTSVLMQGVVWTAGFSNYVVPIAFLLLFINCNKRMFYGDKSFSLSKKYFLLYLFLGFITVLFIEHLTIYCMILSVFVLIYSLIKYKKIIFANIGYFLGCLMGTILMFSNSSYSSIASGNDGYRSFNLSNIMTSSLKTFVNNISNELVYNNYVLNFLLVLIIISILFVVNKKIKKGNFKKKLSLIISIILISFVTYSLVTSFNEIELFLRYTNYFNAIFSLVFCLSILTFVILFIDDKYRKYRMIFTLASIVLIALPLLVVSPIGSRCFVPTYVLFILFVTDLFGYLLSISKKGDLNNISCLVLSALILVFSLYLLGIYSYINKVYITRINYIEDHKNEEVIVLPKLPYSEFVWYGDPANAVFTERFKLFYNINESTEVKFVDKKEWENIKVG